MISVSFPPRFTNSLRQLGRLHPDGKLILDDCTSEGGLRGSTTVENVHFQPLDLGYLGKFSVVTDAQGSILKEAHAAKAQLRRLEKVAAERKMAESEPPLPWFEEPEGILTLLIAAFLGGFTDGPLPLADTHTVVEA